MGPLLCLALACAPAAGDPAPPCPPVSYLYQPAFCMDYELREPAVPYVPRPGDIFVCTGCEMWAKLGHFGAGTGAPQHSGIVFLRPDGRPALLEGGPNNTLHCEARDLVPQLQRYAEKERVWIRRRCVPLTAEQCEALTAFALSAEPAHAYALLFKTEATGPTKCAPPGKPLEIKLTADKEKVWLGFNDEKGRFLDNHLGKGRRHEHDPFWLRIEVVRIVVD